MISEIGQAKRLLLAVIAIVGLFNTGFAEGLRGDPAAIADARAMVEKMGGIAVWASLESVHFVHEWDFVNRPDRYLENEVLDMTGYELKITGGSDHAGFPLRGDIPGQGRRKILTRTGVVGVKVKKGRSGVRVRKTVNAQAIDVRTVQVNL